MHTGISDNTTVEYGAKDDITVDRETTYVEMTLYHCGQGVGDYTTVHMGLKMIPLWTGGPKMIRLWSVGPKVLPL